MAANPGNNPGFTLAEDSALKKRLSDIPVSDDADAQRIAQVFFRHPEHTTEKTFPYITIELLDIAHATDRQHSLTNMYYANGVGITPDVREKLTSIDYYPSEMDSDDLDIALGSDGFVSMDSFTPVDLIYQVTTYARSQRHDRQLTAIMLRRVTPFQGRGWMEVPEDGTMRRLELLNWASSDILDNEAGYKKRIFRKVFTVRVNAELPVSDIRTTKRALSVHGTLNGHTETLSDDPILSEEF